MITRALLAQMPAFPEIEDIEPPLADPTTLPWLWIALGLVIAAIITIVIYRLMKPSVPAPTASEIASEQLATAQTLVDTMSPHEFSIVISDILRGYVSNEFGLPAPRQTSAEFLSSVQNRNIFRDEAQAQLSQFLTTCDAIKFARAEATNADCHSLLTSASALISAQGGGNEA